ncbi:MULTISPECIES: helix-turn-helix domain-containing protein [unclassified Shimia]|uniref:helix-turn-helix domain-containing protein n=1 Tax=unclassified Shimia TaxID=2630038 RepID=UPI003105D8A9
MKLYDIGALSRSHGVAVSTLRYYEEVGLITSVGRNGLRRQFGPDAPLRLSLIALGKLAGFSLTEISEIFGSDSRVNIPREDLRARADDLMIKAKRLEALADMVRHVAECPAPSHLECPTFQKLLTVAPRLRAAAG